MKTNKLNTFQSGKVLENNIEEEQRFTCMCLYLYMGSGERGLPIWEEKQIISSSGN